MKRTRPPKGFIRPTVQETDGTPHRNVARRSEQRVQRSTQRPTDTTMAEKAAQTFGDEGVIPSEGNSQEVHEATPDELREQVRELTEKNCAAALQEIQYILDRRGLKMYPIVHVEGNAANSIIAVAPK